MEAIREGIQDHEYLTMLRRKIDALDESGVKGPDVTRARKLLTNAARRVLDAPNADKSAWREDKDRSVADTVRIEVGELLERIK